MSRTLYAGLAAVIVVVLGIAGWFWWDRQATPHIDLPPPVATVPPAAPEVAPAASVPAIKHPIEAMAAASEPRAEPGPLPALDNSDAHARSRLNELLGRKAVLSWLQTEAFARNVVATVDNLARPHAAPRMWPVNPTPGRFTVAQDGQTERISPDNSSRYTPFVLFVENIDAGSAAATYARLYPLFQQAYEELGYPGRYFNDRLVEVIDHLLQTPEFEQSPEVRLTEVRGPVKPERPWVRYEFADPALESLSSGQKLLLRMGPVNERRLKTKLRELRRELVSGSLVR
jgi:hypothetical protein